MATVKLGMLVSQIAGSIGGTTFRRAGNSIVMQNKTLGASKSKTLQNPALIQMSDIIKSWSTLSNAVRADWVAAALNFQFTDKFGDLKNLSGRQLYVKLTNFNFNAGLASPDPTVLSSVVTTVYKNKASIQTDGTAVIEFNAGDVGVMVAISAELNVKTFEAPIFNTRKITKFGTINVDNKILFGAEFWAQFPQAVEGDNVRIYYFSQNIYGFKSLTQFFDTIVELSNIKLSHTAVNSISIQLFNQYDIPLMVKFADDITEIVPGDNSIFTHNYQALTAGPVIIYEANNLIKVTGRSAGYNFNISIFKNLNLLQSIVFNIPNNIFGDLQFLPANLISLSCVGNNTIAGDLALLPSALKTINLQGPLLINTYTFPHVWADNMQQFTFEPNSLDFLSTIEIDNLLIDLSNVAVWIGNKYIYLLGTNAPRSVASDNAVATLVAKGVNVVTN